jgi:UDP-glucose 6-dehydrogenase
MKIAYANMIGDIADASINANKYDILNAVGHDGRVGTKCLKPGQKTFLD